MERSGERSMASHSSRDFDGCTSSTTALRPIKLGAEGGIAISSPLSHAFVFVFHPLHFVWRITLIYSSPPTSSSIPNNKSARNPPERCLAWRRRMAAEYGPRGS